MGFHVDGFAREAVTMPERFVTVATYGAPLEAEMAKNLLETEGIASFLEGDLTASAFFGNSALGLIRLQRRPPGPSCAKA